MDNTFNSKISWFATATLSIIGVGASVNPAIAQTNFDYSATFDGISLSTFISPNITDISYEGDSNDASLGLTQLSSLLYSEIDPVTSDTVFSTNPSLFGIEDRQNGFLVFQGNSDDKLFASFDSSTGSINFETGIQTLTGTVNIFGGEGRFNDAQGSLSLEGSLPIDIDPPPTEIVVNGSFTVPKSVPEASTLVTCIALGVTGAGAMFKRHLI